jgi:predicted transcriptional regulator
MSVKEQLLASIQNLPDNATWQDAEERIRYLSAIDEGRAQLDRGQGIAHEDVKAQVRSWFQK